jgi:hypothetical protein
MVEILSCSIHHMFSECKLVQEELNALNRIAVKEICVIIVAKVVLIGQTILTQIAQFP